MDIKYVMRSIWIVISVVMVALFSLLFVLINQAPYAQVKLDIDGSGLHFEVRDGVTDGQKENIK